MSVALERGPIMPKIIETPRKNPGTLPLRTRRPDVQTEPSGVPVYTIRGLQGTTAELLATPRAATLSLLTAQSIVYDNLVNSGNIADPDVAKKTVDGFTYDRIRLVEGIFGESQPAETMRDPHEEATELISTAATIYQGTSEGL